LTSVETLINLLSYMHHFVRPTVRAEHQATDQLASPLGRALLDLPKGWTDEVRENAITTALLMFAPVIEGMQVRDGIEQGRYVLDTTLFENFYRQVPDTGRALLLRSPAAQYLPPDMHRRMFKETYPRPGLSSVDKARLGISLGAFLRHHPSCAMEYEDEILGMLRSRHLEHSGMWMMATYLTRISLRDRVRLERKLDQQNPETRRSALQAFSVLLERRDVVDITVSAHCTSASLMARVKQLTKDDPDPAVRRQARNFLKGLRIAKGMAKAH